MSGLDVKPYGSNGLEIQDGGTVVCVVFRNACEERKAHLDRTLRLVAHLDERDPRATTRTSVVVGRADDPPSLTCPECGEEDNATYEVVATVSHEVEDGSVGPSTEIDEGWTAWSDAWTVCRAEDCEHGAPMPEFLS